MDPDSPERQEDQGGERQQGPQREGVQRGRQTEGELPILPEGEQLFPELPEGEQLLHGLPEVKNSLNSKKENPQDDQQVK